MSEVLLAWVGGAVAGATIVVLGITIAIAVAVYRRMKNK